MARQLRIHVPDGWYHVMSRGNGGEDLYRTDDDRRRFLGLVAELPDRFGTEIHAFVLMGNHYHLLVRCRRTDLSETMRWLQTAYAIKFNWAHRRRGHVFQGRFKSVLIKDEAALGSVARYLHLNPVRIGGLGLSKKDQQRAKVIGCPDPGKELIARRLAVLREHRWSSWRVYGGGDPAPAWLTRDPIESAAGGRSRKDQREALIAYTEDPIRQGGLTESVGGDGRRGCAWRRGGGDGAVAAGEEDSREAGGGDAQSRRQGAPGLDYDRRRRRIDPREEMD